MGLKVCLVIAELTFTAVMAILTVGFIDWCYLRMIQMTPPRVGQVWGDFLSASAVYAVTDTEVRMCSVKWVKHPCERGGGYCVRRVHGSTPMQTVKLEDWVHHLRSCRYRLRAKEFFSGPDLVERTYVV